MELYFLSKTGPGVENDTTALKKVCCAVTLQHDISITVLLYCLKSSVLCIYSDYDPKNIYINSMVYYFLYF